MATNFRLYGSSPDRLADSQRAYDAMYLGADQANRAAAVQAQMASIENANRIRAEDEAAAKHDWEREQYRIGLILDQNKQQRDNAFRERALGVDMTRYADAMALNSETRATEAERFNKNFGLQSRELDIRDRATQAKGNPMDRKIEFDYRNAMPYAEQGVFDSPAHVKKLYPSLPDEYVMQLADISKRVRPLIAGELGQYEGAAELLNKRAQVQNYVKLSQEALKDLPTRLSGTIPSRGALAAHTISPLTAGPVIAYNAARSLATESPAGYESNRIKDWNAYLTETADPAARIQADKNVMAGLRFDPVSGRYQPAMPQPAWVPPTATATTAAPPVAAVQPQPMPTVKSQLVPGTTYLTPRGPALWDGQRFVQ